MRPGGGKIGGRPADAYDLARLSDHLDETLWNDEVLAQNHEAAFTQLWDQLRERADDYQVLRELEFQKLSVGQQRSMEKLDWGIVRTTYRRTNEKGDDSREFVRDEVVGFINRFESLGFELEQSEWHHSAFEPAQDNRPARSVISMELNLVNRGKPHRIAVRAELGIEWAIASDNDPLPVMHKINVNDVELLERQAPVAFQPAVKVDPQGR